MYRWTLADAKASGALRAIAGTCTSNQQFIDRLNEAMERLAKRGEFFSMVEHMRLCFQGCNPVWPRAVGTVLRVKACSLQSEMSVENDFSNFPANGGNNGWYNYLGAWGSDYGSFGGWQYGGGGVSNAIMSDNGTACTYNRISGTEGKLIRYYVVKANDIGKKITLFGKQYGGQPLQEKVDDVWENGMTLTAARPFASTSAFATDIQSITREATEGMAYLYEYDPATDLMRDLAVFEPNETNPRYRSSILRGAGNLFGRNAVDANGEPCKHSIEALVKLNFIPVKNDRDFLMVDDFTALKFMIQAIKMEEANDQTEAEKLILKSLRELNFGDRDKNSDSQIPVRTNFTMCNTLHNAF